MRESSRDRCEEAARGEEIITTKLWELWNYFDLLNFWKCHGEELVGGFYSAYQFLDRQVFRRPLLYLVGSGCIIETKWLSGFDNQVFAEVSLHFSQAQLSLQLSVTAFPHLHLYLYLPCFFLGKIFPFGKGKFITRSVSVSSTSFVPYAPLMRFFACLLFPLD